MAAKIMLVIDNKDDQDFMEKVLLRLQYDVISMKNGRDLSEQLIDHFPDVVFASTLGRNAKILNALGKIKEIRGKPKLVFVKMKNEKNTLTPTQKEIIDGTIYTPVDPFKLIDLLAQTTDIDKIELRRRYNEMLASDRGSRGKTNNNGEVEVSDSADPKTRSNNTDGPVSKNKKNKKDDYGQTQVIGKHRASTKTEVQKEDPDYYGTVNPEDISEESKSTRKKGESEAATNGKTSVQEETGGVESGATADDVIERQEAAATTATPKTNTLLHDPKRKRKYDEITARLKAEGDQPTPMDVQKLREKQRAQAQEVSEDETIKNNRKHFLKTLFSISPESVVKK